jgi:hypothetical protein
MTSALDPQFVVPNGRTFRSTGQRRAVQVGDWHLCNPLIGPMKVEYLAPDEVHICMIWKEVPNEAKAF